MSSNALATPPAAPLPPTEPTTSALETFLDQHLRKILIAFAGLLVVAALVGAWRYHAHQEEEAAAIEATKAKTEDDCDLVVQHHPGTVAAGDAMLLKAKLLWDKNKKDPSVAVLREFVQKYPDHPFNGQGTLSLASRLETMGGKNDVSEARGLYEKLAGDKSTDVSGLAQLRLADMLWNEGKEEDAKKAYEALPNKLTGSPFFEQNEERLKWLAANLPTKEVDGPKPPAEPPASLKAPTPKGPMMNLKSGTGSPLGVLGGARPNITVGQPVAIPAAPKPGGVVTPGAALPLPGKPAVTIPAPAAAPAPATAVPTPTPTPTPTPNPNPNPNPNPAPAPAPAPVAKPEAATSPAVQAPAPAVVPAPAPAPAAPPAAAAPVTDKK